MSVTQNKSTCLKLVHGFIRINNPVKYFALRQIASIVAIYHCSIVSAIWQISQDQIPNKESMSITGPQLVISGYKFVTKLTRNDNRLYFGICYQESQQIQTSLYNHFYKRYNKKTANNIIKSFSDIIRGYELDQLLFDIEDINESFILAHVEKELNKDELLASRQILEMKQDIVDIVGDKISFMFNYHVRFQTYQYKQLVRFNAIQIMEQKTEIAIADDGSDMKFEIDLEVFDDEYYEDGYHKYKREVNQEWDIAALMEHQFMKMKQGEIIYFDNFSVFTIFIKKINGLYYVYIHQYKPSYYNELDPMMVVIDELTLCIDNVEVFKLKDFSVKADKYISCGIIQSGSNASNMIIAIKWH